MVRLFVARAQAARHDFTLADNIAADVAAICRRLGLPLAIEFAAARLNALPLPALLARSGAATAGVDGGGARRPARQQTMRDAIAWSYDLLPPGEQQLFAAWRSSWAGSALDAAATVIGPLDDARQPRHGRASSRSSMPVSSASIEQPEALPRYVMLETIREYGWSSWRRAAKNGATRCACTWYLVLTDQAEQQWWEAGRPPWARRFEADYANLRAALEWFERQGRRAGLRLASALTWFWWTQTHAEEGRRWLERVLDRVGANRGSRPCSRARRWPPARCR